MIFDVGTKLDMHIIGEIVEYTKTKNGDCYVVQLNDEDKTKLFFTSKDLELWKAKEANKDEDVNYYDLFHCFCDSHPEARDKVTSWTVRDGVIYIYTKNNGVYYYDRMSEKWKFSVLC